jgi:mono/diheme cytochrome c family protein
MKNGYLWLSMACTLTIFMLVSAVAGASVEAGKKVFDEKCKSCHGGTEPDSPSLLNLSQKPENEIKNAVRNGVQGTEMPSFTVNELNESDLDNLVAYIKNSTPPATPIVTSTPIPTIPASTGTPTKAPGFEIVPGLLGILLIYLLRRED